VPTLGLLGGYQSLYSTDSTAVSTEAIWLDWNVQWVAQTSASTLVTAQTSISSATELLAVTWTSWNETSAGTVQVYTTNDWTAWNQQTDWLNRSIAPETVARVAQQTEQHRVAASERLERQRAARARARDVLRRHLTTTQREELDQHGHFTVIAHGSRRVYRVRQGRAGNVQLLDPTGKAVRTYCCHPADMVPDEDTMLSQKLMLEHAEDDFLRLANVH
jgi:hypothetical protein